MFLNSVGFAGGMVTSRLLGTQRRMMATPTSGWTLLAGDLVGRLVIVAVQAIGIIAVTSLFFDVHWGDPLPLAALVALFAVISVTAAEIAGATATTREQVLGAAAGFGVGWAMIGGCVWPLSVVSPQLASAGHLVPQAWAMDGLIDLSTGADLASLTDELTVLAAFAFAFTVAAGTALTLRGRKGW